MSGRVVVAMVMITVGVLPLMSVLMAGLIADRYGCELHEGFVQRCMVHGADIGGALYTMLSFGWLMLISIFFLAGGILCLLGEVLRYAVRRLSTGLARKP